MNFHVPNWVVTWKIQFLRALILMQIKQDKKGIYIGPEMTDASKHGSTGRLNKVPQP